MQISTELSSFFSPKLVLNLKSEEGSGLVQLFAYEHMDSFN